MPSVALHEKYGNVVRLGPSKLSFAKPDAIRDIYGTKGIRQKVLVVFYPALIKNLRFDTLSFD